jgi:hypothetical protein
MTTTKKIVTIYGRLINRKSKYGTNKNNEEKRLIAEKELEEFYKVEWIEKYKIRELVEKIILTYDSFDENIFLKELGLDEK